MGRIICEDHGVQPFYEMCIHLFDALESGIWPEMKTLPIIDTYLCQSCFDEYRIEKRPIFSLEDFSTLSTDQQEKIEKQITTIYDTLELKGKCVECVKAIQLQDTKNNNRPVPFQAFENTLMHREQATIDQLGEWLRSQFRFQKSKYILTNNDDALFIKSGAMTYPLSIKIYYVIDATEQMQILSLIEQFFETVPQKQRKVSFYEAEHWRYQQNGEIMRILPGDELLLLEKEVY